MISESDCVVVVGRIQGAYGVQGWVHLQSYTDPIQNLLDYAPWLLESATGWREIEPVQTRPHKQGFVAELSGIGDRNSAAMLQGKHIGIAADVLPSTDEDEYYWRDLIGLEVVDSVHTLLGTVTGMLETGAHGVMVICSGGGGRRDETYVDADREILIPFARRYVIEVDQAAGHIIVDWQET